MDSGKLQHTIGHVDCPACEALRKCVMSVALDEVSFDQAWPIWFEEKAQTIGLKTQQCYGDYRKALSRFFGQLELGQIHIGHIIEYRKQRMAGWKTPTGKFMHGAGPNLINHEIDALRQLMQQAGCWARIQDRYKQLRVEPSTIGQRPTEEEIVYLFQCAQKQPRWRVAYLAMTVMVQTAAGPEEVLATRLGHIDWNGKSLHIHGTKNKERPRDIPMTEDCFFALRELELIARAKGAAHPDHYLFPHKGTKDSPGHDPSRHQGEIRKAWKGLCSLAAKKYPRLLHLRRKDLRHFSLSTIMENPLIDEHTAKKIAGHGPGSRMAVEVYFHARRKRKEVAVSVLQGITQPKPVQPATPPEPPITAKRKPAHEFFVPSPSKEFIQ